MIHILYSMAVGRPWWRADERLDVPPDRTIITDCCLCKMPASEVDCRLMCVELPLGGYGDYQYGKKEWGEPGFSPPYEDCRWETRCAVGYGCDAKPRRRSSRHLRAWRYEL